MTTLGGDSIGGRNTLDAALSGWSAADEVPPEDLLQRTGNWLVQHEDRWVDATDGARMHGGRVF